MMPVSCGLNIEMRLAENIVISHDQISSRVDNMNCGTFQKFFCLFDLKCSSAFF